MIQRFRAGEYSVYEMHRLCVCMNLPNVESSVVIYKYLKLDPTFWVFMPLSKGMAPVGRWESTNPQQKQHKNSFFNCNGSLNAGILMGN